jgi:hypothetical protein
MHCVVSAEVILNHPCVLVQQQLQSLFSAWNEWWAGVLAQVLAELKIENTTQLRVSVPPRETPRISLWIGFNRSRKREVGSNFKSPVYFGATATAIVIFRME